MGQRLNRVQKFRGFSLIELSIAIFIVGLVTAVVLSGKQIIKSAKVQAQISQLSEYKNAYESFKQQFNTIPGDMPNATDYWDETANGNGDFVITNNADDFNFMARSNDIWFESYRFFEHLHYGGFIEQNFDNQWSLNIGYPELKISPGKGLSIAGRIQDRGGRLQLSAEEMRRQYTAFLAMNIAKPHETARSYYNDRLGTASPEMYRVLDGKIDDGVANSGDFRAYTSNVTDASSLPGGDPYDPTHNRNCLTAENGDYDLNNKSPVCHGAYILER